MNAKKEVDMLVHLETRLVYLIWLVISYFLFFVDKKGLEKMKKCLKLPFPVTFLKKEANFLFSNFSFSSRIPFKT